MRIQAFSIQIHTTYHARPEMIPYLAFVCFAFGILRNFRWHISERLLRDMGMIVVIFDGHAGVGPLNESFFSIFYHEEFLTSNPAKMFCATRGPKPECRVEIRTLQQKLPRRALFWGINTMVGFTSRAICIY